jgi:hypothetical protein
MNNYNFYHSIMNGVDCSSVMSYIYPIPVYGRIMLTIVSPFEQLEYVVQKQYKCSEPKM